MKWYSFVSCFLAAGSLVVFPDLSLAHGGGGGGGHGFGGGGFGGHSFGGGGSGGHAFGRSGFGGHGFGRSFGGFRGTRAFAERGVFSRVGRARFADRGFRGRDRDFRGRRFRDFNRSFFGFGFDGFGDPYYYPYDYSYYYPYDYPFYDPNSDYGDGVFLSTNNSGAGTLTKSEQTVLLVQSALAKRGYYRGMIDGVIGPRSRRAIRGFQNDQGLPVTGSIDGKLIKTLRIG